MKCVSRNLVYLLLFFFPLTLFGQDIPNAGFEVWDGNIPNSWMPNDTTLVKQSNDGNQGSNYSVQLEIAEDQGILYNGSLYAGSEGMGFDYFQRPDELTGYYKLSPHTGDHLWIDVWFYKDNGTTLVGHGQETIPDAASEWTEFTARIFYILPDDPDRCVILVFIGFGGTQEAGGKLWVDDLHFQFANEVEEISGNIPDQFELLQNYPNPFNPSTKIRYSIPLETDVVIKVYNMLGKEISTLIEGEKPIGNYEIDFDGSNFSSGVYFYKIQAGDFVVTKKMLLMK